MLKHQIGLGCLVECAASCRYHQAVTQVSYQLQRQLLVESRRKATFTGSIRSKQEPCVVVYVVVPSDSAAEVLHALHVVAQALAPCSSLGLAEVKAQLEEGSCAPSVAGGAPAGACPFCFPEMRSESTLCCTSHIPFASAAFELTGKKMRSFVGLVALVLW